ncbi:hypothetical protein [Mycobacterium sp.]|uniref:hypothetical protein n=1 Tax=Mycobacterium sp. TaxID=1785 RepID=UPI0039C9792C
MRQLDAAAAGAELVELELSDELELDFSDDDDELDEAPASELALEPLDPLLELLAGSRLSVR